MRHEEGAGLHRPLLLSGLSPPDVGLCVGQHYCGDEENNHQQLQCNALPHEFLGVFLPKDGRPRLASASRGAVPGA